MRVGIVAERREPSGEFLIRLDAQDSAGVIVSRERVEPFITTRNVSEGSLCLGQLANIPR